MAEIVTKAKTRSTAGRDDERSDSNLPPLRVRYYRVMKPQRVWSAEVSWQKSARPQRGEVTVRFIAAGAQVLPGEQTMDAAKPDVKAVFYVTPLAKGWLRNEKLEVLSQGRKIQEIPLATKVVSQRLTWFLLFCTFFVPWFILDEIKYGPMATPAHRVDERFGLTVTRGDKGKEDYQLTRKADERQVYRKIAKDVEKNVRANVPEVPDFLDDNFVGRWLVAIPSVVGKGFQELAGVSGILPIAYYAGAVFLGLTLLSAYFHMPKRRITTGQPIPVLAVSKSADQ